MARDFGICDKYRIRENHNAQKIDMKENQHNTFIYFYNAANQVKNNRKRVVAISMQNSSRAKEKVSGSRYLADSQDL